MRRPSSPRGYLPVTHGHIAPGPALSVAHFATDARVSFSSDHPLAIGIDGTTAIFSTVNVVLLKPSPYPNASDLYSLYTNPTDGRVTSGLLSPVEALTAE